MEGNGPKSLPGGVGGGKGGVLEALGACGGVPKCWERAAPAGRVGAARGSPSCSSAPARRKKKKKQEKKEKSCHHRALRTPGLLGPVPSLCLPVLDPPGRALPPPGPLIFLGTMRKPWGIWHSDTVVVVFFISSPQNFGLSPPRLRSEELGDRWWLRGPRWRCLAHGKLLLLGKVSPAPRAPAGQNQNPSAEPGRMRGCKQAPIVPAPGVYTGTKRPGGRPGAWLPPPRALSLLFLVLQTPRAFCGAENLRTTALDTRGGIRHRAGGRQPDGTPGEGDLFPFCSFFAPFLHPTGFSPLLGVPEGARPCQIWLQRPRRAYLRLLGVLEQLSKHSGPFLLGPDAREGSQLVTAGSFCSTS